MSHLASQKCSSRHATGCSLPSATVGNQQAPHTHTHTHTVCSGIQTVFIELNGTESLSCICWALSTSLWSAATPTARSPPHWFDNTTHLFIKPQSSVSDHTQGSKLDYRGATVPAPPSSRSERANLPVLQNFQKQVRNFFVVAADLYVNILAELHVRQSL